MRQRSPVRTKDENKYTYNDADQMAEVKMDKGAEMLASPCLHA